MKTKSKISAYIFRSSAVALVFLCAVVALSVLFCGAGNFSASSVAAPTIRSNQTLTFADRVAYQRAIEEVYWRHRIWPKDRPAPKPSLDAVMSQAQFEKKVQDYLRDSQALEDYWQRPITAEALQAEMDRMAKNTKQPEVLRELFDALGNDPFLIAECLVRPVLSARLITSVAEEQRKGRLALWEVGANIKTRKVILANATYTLPTISDTTTGCTPDSWTDTSTTNVPVQRRFHTAVWTGSEMIIWGGFGHTTTLFSGGRYNPSTDSWTHTTTAHAPDDRESHTAVWTGSEMIVWGGDRRGDHLNTGGRYNPSTDTWTATNTTNAPPGRTSHTAVWTGSEMIVWGGFDGSSFLNTGGRYNPSTDTWTATSTTNAPEARDLHTAVWTGSEMIVWGGQDPNFQMNTGGRYNPGSNSWTATSTTNAPTARDAHTAVWSKSEMIVFGGFDGLSFLNTGGRYNPGTDSWTATSTTDAPAGRDDHTAVWTDSEMIVWGGDDGGAIEAIATGGRYNPDSDTWIPTSTTNAPTARSAHTAVWTGSEMIIWGGADVHGNFDTGGRYCVQRSEPTPRPRPTPGPRP